MSYDLMGDVGAICIIASHSLASDGHLQQSKSNSFSSFVHNSTSLSITSFWFSKLLSIFLNVGDHLQGFDFVGGGRAFCFSLWMVYGPLNITWETNNCHRQSNILYTWALLPSSCATLYTEFWSSTDSQRLLLPRSIFAWVYSLGNQQTFLDENIFHHLQLQRDEQWRKWSFLVLPFPN